MEDRECTDVVQFTKENIANPELRKVIFGRAEVKKEDIENYYILNMNSILVLSFFAFYLYWKDYVTQDKSASTNEKRINECFSSLYSMQNLSWELISYSLTEILIDVNLNGSRSQYDGMMECSDNTAQFQMIYGLIRQWRGGFNSREKDRQKLKRLYVTLVETLSVLQNMDLIYDEEEWTFRIYYKRTMWHDIHTSPYIKKGEDLFFLNSVERAEENYKLVYVDIQGSTMDEQDRIDLQELEQLGFYKKKANGEEKVKKLYTVQYKYIQRLSLSLADVIDAKGGNTKEVLKRKYKNIPMYRELFEITDNNDHDDWDNIITILMLEEGPSKLLDDVFCINADLFSYVLRNVCLRFNLDYKELYAKYEKVKAEEDKYLERVQSVNIQEDMANYTQRYHVPIMVRIIISAVANSEKEMEAMYFSDSIIMKKARIERIQRSRYDIQRVIGDTNKILERTFRFLILFYRGMLAYSKVREDGLAVRDSEGINSEAFVHLLQQKCERAFFDEVEKIKGDTVFGFRGNEAAVGEKPIGGLISMFRELCDGMVRKNSGRLVLSEESKLLYAMIGRKKICETRKLNKILQCNKEDFKWIEDKHYPKDLVEFLNSSKHDKPRIYVDDGVRNIYLGYTLELLDFLTYNSDYTARTNMLIQTIYDPIYPYVVRYNVQSINRDRCQICEYNINDKGGFESKIKMLSEFEYNIDELYYCIPNMECSTGRWWVSPFLISCRRFDSLLLELEA